MISAALLLSLMHSLVGCSLEGAVRSTDGFAPVIGALVEVTLPRSQLVERAITDSAGRYVLTDLASGTYHVRVSRIGYDARELDVLVFAAPRVVVDVLLAPRPQLLSELRVRAANTGHDARQDDLAPDPFDAANVSGAELHTDPALESPDALQSLVTRGLAEARDESPTSLHVRGGGASENSVYIDGVPVFNAYHASGTLTALDPDVISSVSLDRGAPGARFGDATGGMIELTTTTPDSERTETRGGFGARAFRESVGGPLPLARGTFLLAIRRSLDASLSDSRGSAIGATRFGDLFAKVTIPVRSGELELFSLHGSDGLSFAGTSEDGPGAQLHRDREHDDGAHNAAEHNDDARGIPVPPLASTNHLGWTSGTDAIAWQAGGPTRWELRAWHTRFDARFAWTESTQLVSSLERTGAMAGAAWRWGGIRLDGGIDASGYDVRYRVTDLGAVNPPLGAQTPLALMASAPLVSTFADAQWNMGPRLSASTGVRSALVSPSTGRPEPRLSMRFRPTSSLTFGVGYARTHQHVQSLRNEESLVDAIAGISLPVLAGSRFGALEVPAAQSDQYTANADVRLSSSLSVSATAFARHESGAVLVAPVTGQPFALTGFAVGSTHARGMSLSLLRQGQRLSGELGYSLGSVVDRADGLTYAPSCDAAQVVSAAVGVRIAPATNLRIATTAHSGAPTSIIADQIEWTPYTPAEGHGDLAGSPQQVVGALNGSRLPPYFRIDVGIRREWRLRAFGREGSLRTDAGLTNLFGRLNALGMIAPAGPGSTSLILMPRRSATFGLEWTY